MVPDTDRPRLMDLLEKYATTALTAVGLWLAGIFGIRFHYDSRETNDAFTYAVGWAGLVAVIILGLVLYVGASVRAEKGLQTWGGDSGWRSYAAIPIFTLLFLTQGAIAIHVWGVASSPAVLGDILGQDIEAP